MLDCRLYLIHIMKILKKGGSREKGEEETKSVPHAPVDDTSNFPPLVPIQEVNRAYFVSRYFIGRKDFRNFFSLFFAKPGQSISYREAY